MKISKGAKILIYSNSILNFSLGMFGPLFAVFATKIGGNILDIAWAWAAYLIVSGILIMVVGRMSDHAIKKENLLFYGYTLGTILTFAYIFIDSPTALFLIQAGLGVSAALIAPTWDALYDKYSDRKFEGTVWGIADAIPNITAGPAIILGGLIVKFSSFTALFLIMGTLQIIATVIQYSLLKK